MIRIKQILLWLNLITMSLVVMAMCIPTNLLKDLSTRIDILNKGHHQWDIEPEKVVIRSDAMNTFYLGADNPITVVGGVVDQDLSVRVAKGRIVKQGKGKYSVRVSRPGMDTIIVTNRKTDSTQYFPFRVLRVPDVEVTLAGKKDGIMGSGLMASQQQLVAAYPRMLYASYPKVTSFVLYYTQKGKDPQRYQSRSGRFEGPILKAIQSAKPGDRYAFVDVKVRAEFTGVAAKYNGLSFEIR